MSLRPDATDQPGQQAMRGALRTCSAAAIVAAVVTAGCKPEPVAAPPPAPSAATRPAATAPATTQAATEPANPTYLDVVRAAHPTLPPTQPLPTAVEIREAAHFVLTDPVHLDEQGHLWITRPDGVPAEQPLKNGPAGPPAGDEHVVRDRVRFVWWMPDRAGDFAPHVVAAMAPSSPGGRSELVLPTRRVPIGSREDYDWGRARSWVDGQVQRLVVPTRRGVSIFTFGTARERDPVTEAYQDLGDIREPAATRPTTGPVTAPATTGPATRGADPPPAGEGDVEPAGDLGEPQFLFDPRGVIAWVPAGPGKPGSRGAARFVDGRWTGLTPAAGWPDRLLHLVPLRDGSVTQLVYKDEAEGGGGRGVKVALAAVDTPTVDHGQIEQLVAELSDEDRVARDRAYQQLTQYGPGVWPILREIPLDDQAPETAARLRQLLRSQVTPMLGGMGLQGDQLRLVGRLRDGGVVLYTDQGVTLPNPQSDDPVSHAPAWVAARPGRAVELLTGALVFDATPDRTRFDVVHDTWVVTKDAAGPKQFLGNSFRKLLRKEHAEFTHVVGVDRHGRWLFRRPADVAAATADPAVASAPPTLIIDPTLPDFTPRLPVWTYADAEETGWDKDGWPAVRLEALRMKLVEDRWAPLPKDEQVISEVPAATTPADAADAVRGDEPPAVPPSMPAPVALPATGRAASVPAMPATQATSSTVPTTGPASRPATLTPEAVDHLGPPLLVDPAGYRYYDGVEGLHVVGPDRTESRWTLPGTATGRKPVTLLRVKDGKLFLFNQPGRVLRLKPTPGEVEPFVVEATFARDVPDGDGVRRIWLDPAGRIVFAFDKRLAILFPDGFIPRPIRQLMEVAPGDDE